MMTLYVMMGIPGSGKSTWVKEYLPGARVISPDAYLEEKYNYQWSPVRAGEAWRASYHQIGRLIQSSVLDPEMDSDVVFDAVFPTPQDRSALVSLCKGVGVKVVGVYFQTPYELCLERNSLRPAHRRVPEKNLKSFHLRMTPPFDGEFDQVIYEKGVS